MARLAFLQGGKHQHAGGEIDAIDSERQCLGQAATGIGEGLAEGANLAVGLLGLAQEGVTLTGGDVFAGAVGGVEPDAGGG
jgi:hypothetical protein